MGDELRPTERPPDEEGTRVERPDREQKHQDPAALGAKEIEWRRCRDVGAGVAEPDDERQQRDVERPEDRRHPRLEAVTRIGLDERGHRDEHDPDRAEQEPAALEDLRERRVEDDRHRECRPESEEGRVPAAVEEPEDLDGGDRRDQGDGQARTGPPIPMTIRRTGTRTAALMARSRISEG